MLGIHPIPNGISPYVKYESSRGLDWDSHEARDYCRLSTQERERRTS
jgi:hypothetical protein